MVVKTETDETELRSCLMRFVFHSHCGHIVNGHLVLCVGVQHGSFSHHSEMTSHIVKVRRKNVFKRVVHPSPTTTHLKTAANIAPSNQSAKFAPTEAT